MFEAKIILDSVNESRDRLTTFQLRYPRFIHSEPSSAGGKDDCTGSGQSSKAYPLGYE